MKQLIVVNLTKKTIELKEFKDKWITIKKISNISYGKNGYTLNKMEGDLKTPLGLFKLGPAFGFKNILIPYPYLKISKNSYWVNDFKSIFYNKWVEIGKINSEYNYIISTNKIMWESAEHLIDYPCYNKGIIIEYNTSNPYHKVFKGNKKGSGIFIHIKDKNYTSGCIGVTEKDLDYILKWIKNDKNPYILIKSR